MTAPGNNGVATRVKNENNVADEIDTADGDRSSFHDTADGGNGSDNIGIEHDSDEDGFRFEYSEYKVHKNTFLYLVDLRANNRRTWFEHKYRKARLKAILPAIDHQKECKQTLIPKIMAFDSTIPELPPKDVIFRIYRDVRFSKDKRLSKSHFSAAFSRTGRRRPYRPEAWRQSLSSENFRDMFLPKVNAGVEGALETKPKGYGADHRKIELLRLRNYHVVKPVDDAVFTAEDGQDRIINILSILLLFVTFLNDIIMP
ncbi:hypothetical protein BDV38DRAFT_275433 [Aspergillus pseudotamarii]|uniref:Uncharacterized protein n=1 Tax=Aspergillus pseudotamarii TaxID=132259 RepID=A0A5N6SBP0_ASPPS|nr:uncharacterized protein BDV38DRAFT_275433 [Aspergillus pseudotamarii]KAE8132025.1 hypothetical protein BDV38DRAFT_275433 [Aspergillus pseudotamarii]